MARPSFANLLFECDDSSSLTVENGSRFIRKLPGDRSLGYLHTLYAPLVERPRVELFERLPASYLGWLEWANGAALFDNCISLFGYVEVLTRHHAPEAVTSISIADQNSLFALMQPDLWAEGWTKIGSLVGWNSSYIIRLNHDGRCAVASEAAAYTAPNLDQCLETILARLALASRATELSTGPTGRSRAHWPAWHGRNSNQAVLTEQLPSL